MHRPHCKYRSMRTTRHGIGGKRFRIHWNSSNTQAIMNPLWIIRSKMYIHKSSGANTRTWRFPCKGCVAHVIRTLCVTTVSAMYVWDMTRYVWRFSSRMRRIQHEHKKRDPRPFPTDSVLTRLLHTRPVSEDVPYDELSMKDYMIR